MILEGFLGGDWQRWAHKKDEKLGQESRNILEPSPGAMCTVTSTRSLFSVKSTMLAWSIGSYFKTQPLSPGSPTSWGTLS